jgi:hypothetical protein
MPKLLRFFALLLFAAAIHAGRPADAAIPKCYSNLPYSSYPDPSWTYSHQCYEGTTLRYVYIDPLGRWHLVGSTILP